MTQSAKTKKAFMALFYIAIIVVIALLLFAYIGSEFGLDISVKLMNWLQEKTSLLISGTTITALITGLRFLNTIKTKSDLSVSNMLELKEQITGANNELNSSQKELSNAILTMQAQPKKVEAINNKMTELEEKQKTIIDLLMVYVFKNSSDQTLNELRLAFQESELLKNVRAIQTLDKVPKKEEKKVEDIISSAAEIVATTKKKIKRI